MKDIFEIQEKIDSTNAGSFEELLMDFANDRDDFILDAANLKYVSSAGLRVFLKLKKQKKEFVITDVNPDVYSVFETTGFTEILNIQKKMREISVEGAKCIGNGAFGKVYRLDNETIVKVYETDRNVDLSYIERERETAKKAFVYGLPTAISFDVVKCGKNLGVIYELLDAQPMALFLEENRDKIDEYCQKYVDLAKLIHSTDGEGSFPDAKEIFTSTYDCMSGYISKEQMEHLYALCEAIPKRNTLVHGDFHGKNVMIQDGELMLIDMGDLSVGHPVIELVSLYLLYVELVDRPGNEEYSGCSKEVGKKIWSNFFSLYFGKKASEENEEALKKVLGILSALRKIGMTYMSAQPYKENPAVYDRIMESFNRTLSVLLSIKPEQFTKMIEDLDDRMF